MTCRLALVCVCVKQLILYELGTVPVLFVFSQAHIIDCPVCKIEIRKDELSDLLVSLEAMSPPLSPEAVRNHFILFQYATVKRLS
jgi:hypothetical protein